ncbi:transcriptional repressor [Coemansia sp. Benny D115]|nr:transcriptional repressor [Coemansia sp. Benny D115]
MAAIKYICHAVFPCAVRVKAIGSSLIMQSLLGAMIGTSGATAPARMPAGLGLAVYSCSAGVSTPSSSVSSLLIKNASGSSVSILNEPSDESNVLSEYRRSSSMPGLSTWQGPASAPPSFSQSRAAPSTLRLASLGSHTHTGSLPSLSLLVTAAGLASPSPSIPGTPTSASTPTPTAPSFARYPLSAGAKLDQGAVMVHMMATGTKTMAKRKYRCSFESCGKAFTTSGHLARHQRIHTGEKNFACQFPGCTSRFSRQDNMMQHYRTHLSPKSRRNGSPRKVVFMEAAAEHQHNQQQQQQQQQQQHNQQQKYQHQPAAYLGHGHVPAPMYIHTHSHHHHPYGRPLPSPMGMHSPYGAPPTPVSSICHQAGPGAHPAGPVVYY